MGSWVMGKLSETIEETINEWVEQFIKWILTLINELVFKVPTSNFANNVMDFLGWFTGICAVVLALYKIIEYIVNTQNGTQEYPLDEIFLRVIKSAGALLVLPWIIKLILTRIAYPISEYFAAAGSDFEGAGAMTLIKATIAGGALAATSGIVVIAVLIFFLVVFLMFLYSVCVFYVDYLILNVLVGPVALSMIADDNNYFQVWWREFLSQITSILVKLFLFTLVINTLFADGNIFIAIGAGALIIKSPSVLKNMWYGSGGARAASRGAGAAAQMSSKMLLLRMIK
ncbi:ABC transporter ATP-binding protein [Bacillus sp. TS-2]|nr:ABC transporter ATP-binding protein [Bacillus sp. TS-2]